MAITITNTSALIATHNLARNQADMNTSLTRLATGLRINSAKDDPAGLIASEYLRSEMAQTTAAINGAQRADQVLSTADGALAEVSNLLVSLQGLVTESANTAGLSGDEIQANQLQVDSIVQSIDRITANTSFGGIPLLNGAFAYTTTAGANSSALGGLNITNAQVPAGGQNVNVAILASAQHAELIAHNLGTGLASAATINLAGNLGSVSLSFASGAHASSIAFSINQFADSTGITASSNGTDVALLSSAYGSEQFVSVQSNSGAFVTQNSAGVATQAIGVDATVAVNGQPASAQGLHVIAHSGNLKLSFDLDPSLNVAGGLAQFQITGGGATFNLGPHIDGASELSLGLGNLGSNQLGFSPATNEPAYSLSDLTSGGRAELSSNNLAAAQKVVTSAIHSVAATRGQIGAYRAYDIQSSINFLNVQYENLSSAESQIRDTDFAAETASLARSQILTQMSQFALSTAEKNQNIILKLLGQ